MDCSLLSEIPYSAFGQTLVRRAYANRTPLGGSFEVTFRCNLRCAHCYVAYGHAGLPDRQELTRAEIAGLFDQMAAEGVLWLLLTGGEPLLRPDLPDIYADARRRGLLVTLFTNGTLLTPRIADLLAERPPHNLEITLYGATQATYERVTGIPGSYARCLRGIQLLLERNLPLKLKTMLMTLNRHELGEMQRFAASLDVPFRYDSLLMGGLGENDAPFALRLPPAEAAALEASDPAHCAAWQADLERVKGARVDARYAYQCGAGLTSFHINPYGELSLCMQSRRPAYDLRRGAFHQGWREALYSERFRPPQLDPRADCWECDLQTVCAQCPGWSHMEHISPHAKVEYLCQMTRQRAAMMMATPDTLIEKE